jgi:serine protease AprX
MTGTSAAAAFVSGVAALVAAQRKHVSPTQIKGAIVASGRAVSGSVTMAVDAPTALVRTTAVNVGVRPSELLLQILMLTRALKLKGVTWEGVTWDGVTWDGVTWDGITWDGVTWQGVTWNGVTWNGVTWESLTWESINWDGVNWETVSWETVSWEGVTWSKVKAK